MTKTECYIKGLRPFLPMAQSEALFQMIRATTKEHRFFRRKEHRHGRQDQDRRQRLSA